MSQVFKIKQNDTLPTLKVSIKSKGNLFETVPYNLDDVSEVTFTMIDKCNNTKVYSQPGTIICPSGGTIQYAWQTGDTDTPGLYQGEFRLLFTNNEILSIPPLGGIAIEIIKSINQF